MTWGQCNRRVGRSTATGQVMRTIVFLASQVNAKSCGRQMVQCSSKHESYGPLQCASIGALHDRCVGMPRFFQRIVQGSNRRFPCLATPSRRDWNTQGAGAKLTHTFQKYTDVCVVGSSCWGNRNALLKAGVYQIRRNLCLRFVLPSEVCAAMTIGSADRAVESTVSD